MSLEIIKLKILFYQKIKNFFNHYKEEKKKKKLIKKAKTETQIKRIKKK